MSNFGYSIDGYIAKVIMSYKKHILVEGRDDKMAFTYLLYEFFHQSNHPEKLNIIVDTAQEIKADLGSQQVGNRDKVEQICSKISGITGAEKLVGFVDREYRRFDLNLMSDQINGHYVNSRLVWSKGHSIENYYFNVSLLREPLRACSTTSYFNVALELFENIFNSILRLACALSLTLNECGSNYGRVASFINWQYFELNSFDVTLNTMKWKQELTQRNLPTVEIDKLLETMEGWYNRLTLTNIDIHRWISHGHIGLQLIWNAYGFCILESVKQAGKSQQEARRETENTIQLSTERIFNAWAHTWSRLIFSTRETTYEYPREVLQLIGLIEQN